MYINKDDLLTIHSVLEKRFPLMTKGIAKKGLLDSVIDKQYMIAKNDNVLYVAASLLETITRWHIFNDGNKRTSLLCALLYLNKHGYYTTFNTIPAVKFIKNVSAMDVLEEDEIKKLINSIMEWLKISSLFTDTINNEQTTEQIINKAIDENYMALGILDKELDV